jgi:hypothetical protein
MSNESPAEPAYLPLVKAGTAHGIPRTRLFELAKSGALRTFMIGRQRYVDLESLRTLPERLAQMSAEKSA